MQRATKSVTQVATVKALPSVAAMRARRGSISDMAANLKPGDALRAAETTNMTDAERAAHTTAGHSDKVASGSAIGAAAEAEAALFGEQFVQRQRRSSMGGGAAVLSGAMDRAPRLRTRPAARRTTRHSAPRPPAPPAACGRLTRCVRRADMSAAKVATLLHELDDSTSAPTKKQMYVGAVSAVAANLLRGKRNSMDSGRRRSVSSTK